MPKRRHKEVALISEVQHKHGLSRIEVHRVLGKTYLCVTRQEQVMYLWNNPPTWSSVRPVNPYNMFTSLQTALNAAAITDMPVNENV